MSSYTSSSSYLLSSPSSSSSSHWTSSSSSSSSSLSDRSPAPSQQEPPQPRPVLLPAGPFPLREIQPRALITTRAGTRIPPKNVHVKAACDTCRKRKIKVCVFPLQRLVVVCPTSDRFSSPSSFALPQVALYCTDSLNGT